MLKNLKRILIAFAVIIVVVVLYAFLSQLILPHKGTSFIPDYEKINLNENSSFDDIFKQTGLGEYAAEKVLEADGVEGLKKYQDVFFAEREIECTSLISFITKSDLIKSDLKPQIADVREGDILVSLSNHTLGWRHGHAGVAIGEYGVVESAILGSDSEIYNVNDWCDFSQFAVLRLKNITPETQKEISDFIAKNLVGVPYKIISGFFGDKMADMNDENFGVHCSYLVWYAYNNFGFDIDSDGGRLVSTYDILHSPLLEVVQIYGIDPMEFSN